MFMEFVEGTSLHDRIEQGPLELSEAVEYVRQVLPLSLTLTSGASTIAT